MTISRTVRYYYDAADTVSLDLSDDVQSLMIDEEDNCIKMAKVKLYSPSGKYAPSDNTPATTHLGYNCDIKISINSTEMFHGYIIEKTTVDTAEVEVIAVSYTDILRKKLVECWRRFRTKESIYTMLTRTDGYQLIYGCKDTPPSPAVAVQLNANGVISDSVTHKVYDFMMFDEGDTVLSALQKLALLTGYRFWVEKTIAGGIAVFTLYFRPKNDNQKTYYHTVAPTTISIQYGDDRLPGNEGNIKENHIRKNMINFADRVVVYGDNSLGVIAESGLSVDQATAETVINDSSIKTFPEALERADTELVLSGVEWFEGDLIVNDGDTLHPAFYPASDQLMYVHDSEAGINDITWRIARVISRYDNNGYYNQLYIDKPAFSIARDRWKLQRSLKIIQSVQSHQTQNTGDSSIDNAANTEANASTCSTLAVDNMGVSDTQYATFIDGAIWGAGGINPGEIDIHWIIANDQPTSALPDSVFVEYQIGYGTIISDELVISPASYANQWTNGSAPGLHLDDITTLTTTITGLTTGVWYALRLFMRVQDGKDPTWVWSNEIVVVAT
jgi:hypothetical protein